MYEPSISNLEDGECEFDLEMPARNRANKIYCHIFPRNNPDTISTKSTSVTTLVLPKIQLKSEFMFDKNDTVSVMAGEESMLTCTVAGARPKPDVLWKIGNPIRHQFIY